MMHGCRLSPERLRSLQPKKNSQSGVYVDTISTINVRLFTTALPFDLNVLNTSFKTRSTSFSPLHCVRRAAEHRGADAPTESEASSTITSMTALSRETDCDSSLVKVFCPKTGKQIIFRPPCWYLLHSRKARGNAFTVPLPPEFE